MPESDLTKAIVTESIESLTASVNSLSNLDTALTAIGADINVLKKSIDDALRLILPAIAKMREGQERASAALIGSTGMVSDSLLFIQQADIDLQNMVRALYRMKAELEAMQKGPMDSARRDRGSIIGRLKAAINHLRGYLSTL
jgi:hypothetical protein